MQKIVEIPFVRKFISYFFVGGIAALVEWGVFFLFSNIIELNYILATAIAFVFATSANWLLGKKWTFKDSTKYENKQTREVVLVFIVSGIGLAFNIFLMWLFVSVWKLNTGFLKVVSKIMATGIVFIWNFLIRQFGIYRQEGNTHGEN